MVDAAHAAHRDVPPDVQLLLEDVSHLGEAISNTRGPRLKLSDLKILPLLVDKLKSPCYETYFGMYAKDS